ncbi:MAG: malto-oligosyltrehalose trehalohydrolase [Verrucomicrobia bacterium]|nr:MAG: malto-oligosyltrehalose trehalohydrolase [Verrucomicrobiota bacterium]
MSKRGRKLRQVKRRYPIGAEVIGEKETHFRVWAPKAREVGVVLEDGALPTSACSPLTPEPDGYFSGTASAPAGARYRFRINGGKNSYPDPASRFQPQGPHGSSCIVDPTKFPWNDAEWTGVKMKGQIIYEMHIGTFTKQGTWRAAAEQLAELARIGITVIEMMPIAEFPGKFGWGYDGVDLFAPSHLYGTPDDLRAFVDHAHSLGLGVILDVVYNHFGPDGNYLGIFSDDYLVRGKGHDWGDVINFDGPNSGPVREFFVTNGQYWIEEFHFDGFRFDATHAIRDQSDEYIIGAVGRAARKAAGARSIVLIAENDLQEANMARSRSEGGDDLDGMWNDDFHHSAAVALTGRNQAYYADYIGAPQEFISAVKYGFLYQGQATSWRKALRGTPALGIAPEAFVCFIENHDQIANTGPGERLRLQTSPGRYRAMTALLLLGPWTPLLFQGEEFGAASPFLFFAEIGDPPVREAVRKGRAKLLAPFLSVTEEEALKNLPAPDDPRVFAQCKLDFSEREKKRQLYALHIDLLKLRREDSRFRQQIPSGVDGAVLEQASFVLRYFSKDNNDRLLLVNFGENQVLHPASEPLLAPPLGYRWETLWTSDSLRYGGTDAVAIASQEQWFLPGESTVALRPVSARCKERRLGQPSRKT